MAQNDMMFGLDADDRATPVIDKVNAAAGQSSNRLAQSLGGVEQAGVRSERAVSRMSFGLASMAQAGELGSRGLRGMEMGLMTLLPGLGWGLVAITAVIEAMNIWTNANEKSEKKIKEEADEYQRFLDLLGKNATANIRDIELRREATAATNRRIQAEKDLAAAQAAVNAENVRTTIPQHAQHTKALADAKKNLSTATENETAANQKNNTTTNELTVSYDKELDSLQNVARGHQYGSIAAYRHELTLRAFTDAQIDALVAEKLWIDQLEAAAKKGESAAAKWTRTLDQVRKDTGTLQDMAKQAMLARYGDPQLEAKNKRIAEAEEATRQKAANSSKRLSDFTVAEMQRALDKLAALQARALHLKNILETGFSGFAATLGAALGQGANFFESFAQSALRAIGNMMENIGEMFLMTGLGLSTLTPLLGITGIGAIAIGTAMIAAGAAMGAAVSGVGGGGAGGGGSYSANYAMNQAQQPPTYINIDVKGGTMWDMSDPYNAKALSEGFTQAFQRRIIFQDAKGRIRTTRG